jgi:hypothetical protein
MINPLNILRFFKNNVFLNNFEKNYIDYNKKKWSSFKSSKSKDVVIVDLFPWYPWIHFYSYIMNYLSKKFDAKICFFYFDFYQTRQSKISLFLSKLKKIFKSFNCYEGLSEYNFKYYTNEKKIYIKKFKKLKFNPQNLVRYKYKGILIGDLIYGTYLRNNLVPHIDMNDEKLEKIFIRAHKIYNEVEKYFRENNVRCVVPSHVCYINYGIISRIASKKKIPIIKIYSKNRGNSLYRILKIDKNFVNEEPPYFNYKKTFQQFDNKHKIKALKIGRQLIKDRVSGYFDPNLPYMTKSSFNNTNLKKLNLSIKRNKIIIFPHCYFDNPHRYRRMIFSDFYMQIKFFLDLSKKNNQFEWYYKPHPNELRGKLDVHKNILKDYPNVIYLDKDISHKSIIDLKPACVITNHGTVSHEYAYFNIPVINTGDNPHINYNFCLHLKSKNQIIKTLSNLKNYSKKINFDKKKIYEYMYLHYEYFPNLNNEKKLLKDDYFSFKNIAKNNSTKIYSKFLNQSNKTDKNIRTYVENFIDKNL